jgi:hypothetical protein
MYLLNSSDNKIFGTVSSNYTYQFDGGGIYIYGSTNNLIKAKRIGEILGSIDLKL